MSDYNIKISELNPPPTPPITEDFFPLVYSASMTTYRVTLQDIGSLITHSIYADTASYLNNYAPTISASWASASLSASYAITAAYAISASHANLADSASFYPTQIFQISSSWSSASLSASHANVSDNVNLAGTQYNFPFWNVAGVNANLSPASPISLAPPSSVISYSYNPSNGPILIDSASTLGRSINSLTGTFVPNYTLTDFFPQSNLSLDGGTSPGGIASHWPITSQNFVGTDQRFFGYATASNAFQSSVIVPMTNYFSGSAGDGTTSGSFIPIGTGPGALSSSFNGQWVRIISNGRNPNNGQVSTHAAVGEPLTFFQDLGGLIRIQVQTPSGFVPGIGFKSNSNQIIYLYVNVGDWSTQGQAQVVSVNKFGSQIVQAGRLHFGTDGNDPWYSFDLLINNLANADDTLTILLQSWGQARFLTTPNWGPWQFTSTGSSDVTQDPTQLIFPMAPGNYSSINAGIGNLGTPLNYYLQGMPVVIDPNANHITQSSLSNPSLCGSSHSLHVSGNINTNTAFYCQNNRGLTTTVTYGSTNLYFSGGILIGKFPPDSYTPATVPCVGPWVGSSVGGNSGVRAMYQDVTYQIGQGTGNLQFYYDTSDNNSASDRAAGLPPGDPTRFQMIYNGVVVWDSDWRGFDTSNSAVLELSTSLAYYAGNSTWCPTVPSVKIANGPTPTYVLLQPSTPTVAYNKTDTVGSTITVRSIAPL